MKQLIIFGSIFLLSIITFSILNPFSYNDGGSRTVVQTAGGDQFVQFQPGIFWAGFFSKEMEWPNRLSVTYKKQRDQADFDLVDNGIEIGKIEIQFSDGPKADVCGTVQFLLPTNEQQMLVIHNTHKSPQSLVTQVLSDFTKECVQSSAQLMSSDKHYGGGKAQMAQDFLDQLRNGSYLSSVQEKVVYDSIEKENKRYYITEIKTKNGQVQRKLSTIKEYGITVINASVIDTEYEEKIRKKMDQIFQAATQSAISRQLLMTAQQKTLTAKAQGEQELVEIEYKQKQEQTRLVVAAETQVKLAEQDKIKQKIAYEASILEAQKIKTLADASAYEKQKNMIADGALDKKLNAYIQVQRFWAEALSKYTGAISPSTVMGASAGNSNGVQNFMEIMTAKAAKDMSLSLSTVK